jgi:hypothetical protein
MPRPSHPSWLDYSNYSWRRVQVMKLLIMQFSPISCLFIPSSFLIIKKLNIYCKLFKIGYRHCLTLCSIMLSPIPKLFRKMPVSFIWNRTPWAHRPQIKFCVNSFLTPAATSHITKWLSLSTLGLILLITCLSQGTELWQQQKEDIHLLVM